MVNPNHKKSFPVGSVRMIKCFTCNGAGFIGRIKDEDEEEHANRPQCPDCNGTGKLEATVVKNG